MGDPLSGRLSQLLEVTVLLRESIDELLSGLTKQLEHALRGEIVATHERRHRRSKRAEAE